MTKHAKTYGGALYDLAESEGISPVILEDVKAVSDIFRDERDYAGLLSAPSIPLSEKEKLLDEAWKGHIHNYTLNFMKLLCSQGKISEFPDAARQYISLYNRDNGIVSARAVCAAPLSEELENRLNSMLEKKTGKKVELSVTVDESLIGGMRLDLDGVQSDNSISYHLEAIRKLLASDTAENN